MASSFLFISTTGPWQNTSASACLDALMTHAIFDQETRLYLTGDGVFQLVDRQEGSAIGQKAVARLFPALELYGITEILVDGQAMSERGLETADLMMPVTIADNARLGELIRICDQVLVF